MQSCLDAFAGDNYGVSPSSQGLYNNTSGSMQPGFVQSNQATIALQAEKPLEPLSEARYCVKSYDAATEEDFESKPQSETISKDIEDAGVLNPEFQLIPLERAPKNDVQAHNQNIKDENAKKRIQEFLHAMNISVAPATSPQSVNKDESTALCITAQDRPEHNISASSVEFDRDGVYIPLTYPQQKLVDKDDVARRPHSATSKQVLQTRFYHYLDYIVRLILP
jgi:hypothetical protein